MCKLFRYLNHTYAIPRCRLSPHLGPALTGAERKLPPGEKLRLIKVGLFPLLIFVSMMVSFLNSWTSLVESSALGAVCAFAVAVIRGRMTLVVFEESVRKSLRITCMFMWIILTALASGAVFDGLGTGWALEDLFVGQLGLNPWVIIILMQLSFLLMGTFLDDTAMLVIVAPLYVPLVKALGFDLIWYGVLYTITCQIDYMTPPFGRNLFLVRAMASPEISIIDIYCSVIRFVGVLVEMLVIMMLFLKLALWQVNHVYG